MPFLLAVLACTLGLLAGEPEPSQLPDMTVGQVCTINTRPISKSNKTSAPSRKIRIKFLNGICEETLEKRRVVSTTWYVFDYEHPAFPDDAFVATCTISPAPPTLDAYDPAKHPQFQNSDFPELAWLNTSTRSPDEVFEGIKCKVFEGRKEVTSRDVNGNLVVEPGGNVRAGLDIKSGLPVFLEDDRSTMFYQFADKERPITLPSEVVQQLDLLAENLLRSEERGRQVP